MGKLYAIGQPTKPTQPFIPWGLINELPQRNEGLLDICCLSQGWHRLVNTYEGRESMA